MSRTFAETTPVMLSTVSTPTFQWSDTVPAELATHAARGHVHTLLLAERGDFVVNHHAARMAHAVRRHFALDVGDSLADFTADELRTWIAGLKAQRDRLEGERKTGLAENRAAFDADKPRAVAAARALVETLEASLETLESCCDVFFELAESPLPKLRNALGEARHALQFAEEARWTARGLELIYPPVGDSLSAAISEGSCALEEKLQAQERDNERLREMLRRAGIELPA